MVFSSSVFLCFFFPVFFLLWYLLKGKIKIAWLLLASLVFYAWGEPVYVFLMIGEILITWLLGLGIGRAVQSGRKKQAAVLTVTGVCLLLGLLFYFKYAGFLVKELRRVTRVSIRMKQILLPIGISFYTFQAISYLIDLRRGHTTAEKDPVLLGSYISMFPQLIAGPIVRYEDVAGKLQQIASKTDSPVTANKVWKGLSRFIIGLAKKMILANTLAQWADPIWSSGASVLSAGVIWFAAIVYALQIYYDFSGYSDMAIGLGTMMGFQFPENFKYPYTSLSVRDFWRRWHITLSGWFRDYVYIPLGGNRKGTPRTMLNLLIVFTLCGIWHGASWNFLVWGLYYGVFLALERIPALSRLTERLPKVLRYAITAVIVTVGWVLFQEKDLPELFQYIGVMFGGPSHPAYPLISLFSMKKVIVLAAAVVCMFPVVPYAKKKLAEHKPLASFMEKIVAPVFLLAILAFSVMLMMAGTYNPFIYFRF